MKLSHFHTKLNKTHYLFPYVSHSKEALFHCKLHLNLTSFVRTMGLITVHRSSWVLICFIVGPSSLTGWDPGGNSAPPHSVFTQRGNLVEKTEMSPGVLQLHIPCLDTWGRSLVVHVSVTLAYGGLRRSKWAPRPCLAAPAQPRCNPRVMKGRQLRAPTP